MPFYTPLTQVEQLPKLDSHIEREVMDWKAPGQIIQTAFHKGKDVAAFANHLGGVILVGACASREGKLAKYEWMDQVKAQAMADAFSRALEQKCDPVPAIDPVTLPNDSDPGKVVLAVNVAPSLRLVGVKADVDVKVEDWDGSDKAFVYPVRVGTTTRFLRASELPMYMTPHVRRVAVLLSRISSGGAHSDRLEERQHGAGVLLRRCRRGAERHALQEHRDPDRAGAAARRHH